MDQHKGTISRMLPTSYCQLPLFYLPSAHKPARRHGQRSSDPGALRPQVLKIHEPITTYSRLPICCHLKSTAYYLVSIAYLVCLVAYGTDTATKTETLLELNTSLKQSNCYRMSNMYNNSLFDCISRIELVVSSVPLLGMMRHASRKQVHAAPTALLRVKASMISPNVEPWIVIHYIRCEVNVPLYVLSRWRNPTLI